MLGIDDKEIRKEKKKTAYIHVYRNLYLIPTPLQEKQHISQIEEGACHLLRRKNKIEEFLVAR
jgi:hypothetical protein